MHGLIELAYLKIKMLLYSQLSITRKHLYFNFWQNSGEYLQFVSYESTLIL